jgi:hypothetical protein
MLPLDTAYADTKARMLQAAGDPDSSSWLLTGMTASGRALAAVVLSTPNSTSPPDDHIRIPSTQRR